jgi:hypothetical protein
MDPTKNGMGSEDPSGPEASSLSALIGRTISVLLTNAIPLFGVVRLGWNASALVLLFVMEGVVVLLSDIVKSRTGRISAKQRPVLFFECAFIFFFGFFAAIAFGPYESLQAAVDGGFKLIRDIIFEELRKPLLAIVFMRSLRLVHDMADSGVFGGRIRRSLQFDGGGWMLLLFFAVMCAPFVAKSGPNPTGGLAALVCLKAAGEGLGVWLERVPPKTRGGGKKVSS